MASHIFGPVPSRRLGISLGLDIVLFKTCTLNCIYCQCGETSTLTLERKSFFDPEIILRELHDFNLNNKHIDYITFSGSGEPTLNKDIGEIITEIKRVTSIPVAVLTNGTLFFMKDVRQDLKEADLVLPSLDAASAEIFSRINRPHSDLPIKRVISGLIEFRKDFPGKIWLEVFIIKNINDDRKSIRELYEQIKLINPDKIQLNSLDRPPACQGVEPASTASLEQIVSQWKDFSPEIIKRAESRTEIASFDADLEKLILNTISRRPLMIEDLVRITGKNRLEILKYIDVLEKEKKIFPKIVADKIFYSRSQGESLD